MNCEQCKNLIFDYIENQLDESQANTVTSHINSCPECKVLYSEMKSIMSSLNNIEQKDLPKGFESELYNGLIKLSKPKSRIFNMKVYKAVAAVAACTVILFAVYNYMPLNFKNGLFEAEMADDSMENYAMRNNSIDDNNDTDTAMTAEPEDMITPTTEHSLADCDRNSPITGINNDCLVITLTTSDLKTTIDYLKNENSPIFFNEIPESLPCDETFVGKHICLTADISLDILPLFDEYLLTCEKCELQIEKSDDDSYGSAEISSNNSETIYTIRVIIEEK